VTSRLNKLAGKLGLEIHRTTELERWEPEFEQIAARCQPFTMISRERMYANYQAAQYVAQAEIPGDIVECGVWKGGSAMVFALTLLRYDRSRTIWLYDTFAGMTEPTELDYTATKDARHLWRLQQRNGYNEWARASLDDVQRNLEGTGYPHLKFIEGKVEDTIPGEIAESIAVLRLDTDWYESTRHELQHLYPRLAHGGVLLIDDYGEWAGARKAVDEHLGADMMLSRLDYTGRVGIKCVDRQRFRTRN